MTRKQHSSQHWLGLRGDATWQFAERAVRLSLGLLVSIIMARTLGPQSFGTYAYALSFVALFAFLGQAGLDSLLLRELVRHPEDAARMLSDSLGLRFGGAILGGAASVCLAILVSSTETPVVPVLVAILSLSGLIQSSWVVESWLQTNHSFRATATAKIIAFSIAAILRILALANPQPLLALAVVSVVESALCAILLWRASGKQLSLGFGKLRRPAAGSLRKLAKLAMPMALSSLTVAIYSRIDVFMLGRIAGTEATGLYGAATLLSEGFYLIPTAVMTAAAPRLTLLFMRDRESFEYSLATLLRILSAAGLLIAVTVSLSAGTAMPMLFGEAYAPASPMLQIHIWSTWMVFVSCVSDAWYINHDLRRLYFLKTAAAAAVNISLNLLLIPRWQGQGAAVATVVSYSLSAVGFGILWPATRPLALIQLRAILGMEGKRDAHQDST